MIMEKVSYLTFPTCLIQISSYSRPHSPSTCSIDYLLAVVWVGGGQDGSFHIWLLCTGLVPTFQIHSSVEPEAFTMLWMGAAIGYKGQKVQAGA